MLMRAAFQSAISAVFGPMRSASAPTGDLARAGSSRQQIVRIIRAKFDAAQTTETNARHWAAADGLSPDAATNPSVRRVLRNRARYECANNSYARGITLTLAQDTIGRGPRLRVKSFDGGPTPKDAAKLERLFHAWAKEIGLGRKLRTMRIARAEAGESFLVLSTNLGLKGPVKLDIRMVEAEQIASPMSMQFSIAEDQNAVDGIKFDEYGNPAFYHVLKWHPGSDKIGVDPEAYDSVPAANVIHYFRQERADQSRGIPEITPALQLFSMLRRYMLAVVAAAETAANIAGVIETQSSPGDMTEADEAVPFDPVDLEPQTFTTMPAGWKMSQFKAEQPTSTVDVFKNSVISEIARCLCMPFNKAAGNSSGYNYSSGQLDHKEYFKAVTIDQTDIEDVVLCRIFQAWLDEAVLVSGLLPQAFRTLETPAYAWLWDRPEHADPTKEASATETRLRTRTTSYARVFAREGLDWMEELEQIAAEQAFCKKLGIDMNPIPAAQQSGAPGANGVKPKPAAEDKEDDQDETTDEPAEDAEPAGASA